MAAKQAKPRLTDAAVKRLPAPEKGYTITLDSERGFGVRVTAKGVRSFILNYYINGRDRCLTIGQFPGWGVTAARARAQELRREIDAGGDPLANKEADRAATTVFQLIDRFEEEWLPRKRPATAQEYKRTIKNHIRPHFGKHTKVADVVYEDIDRLHRKITKDGTPYAANRCVAIMSKMFSLSVKWHMREKNPVKGIEKNPEHHRRRYLSGDELRRLLAALNDHTDRQAADAIRLLLLTGARRGEVLGARWADVDLTEGKWSKLPSSTKQEDHHEVPLSAPARALLSDIQQKQALPKRPLGEFVFPSTGKSGHLVEIKKSWASILKAAGIEAVGPKNLRLHDLRHSYASALVSGGASLPLIGSLLGHSSPLTTARYAHLFSDPQKAAAEKIGRMIEDAGKDSTPDNLVPFKGGPS